MCLRAEGRDGWEEVSAYGGAGMLLFSLLGFERRKGREGGDGKGRGSVSGEMD